MNLIAARVRIDEAPDEASAGATSSPSPHLTVLDLDDKTSQAALARLHDAVAAHVSSRLPWMSAWRQSYPEWRPWILASLDGGEIRAVAPLARRERAGIVHVCCLGHTALDRSPIVCRTAPDAVALADHLARELRHLSRPWTLNLVRLPSDSLFTTSLAAQLPISEVRSDAARPIVVFDRVPDRRSMLSQNSRSAEAKARNRIARAGLTLDIRWINDCQTIASRTSEIRSTHRARDFQLRGCSLLDDPHEGRYWDALVRTHLDVLDLLEFRLAGELAAYLLWIRNGPARLVFDNRVAPRWKEYSAGLIANNVALRAAAEDPSITVLDWGSGLQRYKLQSANKVITHDWLQAWSSRATRHALAARRRLLRATCRTG